MHLHIIAFNIPFPPNYGGVIDVYYKIKALHALGVKITLHCYEYEREHSPQLLEICQRVYYYPRRTGLLANISLLPYNVYSRKSKNLLRNLLKDQHPILFEGLHSCYYMGDKRLRGRYKVFRECNIEHHYYRHLAKAERNLIRKAFFYIESLRFQAYERKITNADWIISVSETDAAYIRKTYKGTNADFIPCFHQSNSVSILCGKSDFLLYHAKLSVAENEVAALFLMKNIFAKLPYKCIVAGMNPSKKLREEAEKHSNVELIANPSHEHMTTLQREAQVNILITFQDTGLKLKLLNSLFTGRHVLVNDIMLAGSGLEDLCTTANTPPEMIEAAHRLMHTPLSEEIILQRREKLFPTYSNHEQAKKIIRNLNEQTP